MKTRLDIILETVSDLLETKRGTYVQRASRIIDRMGGPGSPKGRKFLSKLRHGGREETAREIVQDYNDDQQAQRDQAKSDMARGK